MPLDKKTQEKIKEQLGEQAATYVQDGMLVGLGSGSTSECFIRSLAKRRLKIRAVSSSERSKQLAQSLGLTVLEMDAIKEIDLTIDGADEIDPQKRMIKGGGGAHVREKIVASASHKMIVLVDESKLVSQLGTFGLPIEILPFGYASTLSHLEKKGYVGTSRKKNGALFITDNGNYLYDLEAQLFEDPEKVHAEILDTPGVVDTGFFFNLATNALIGYADGRMQLR